MYINENVRKLSIILCEIIVYFLLFLYFSIPTNHINEIQANYQNLEQLYSQSIEYVEISTPNKVKHGLNPYKTNATRFLVEPTRESTITVTPTPGKAFLLHQNQSSSIFVLDCLPALDSIAYSKSTLYPELRPKNKPQPQ